MNLAKKCDCMKKLIALVLALVCVLSVVRCASKTDGGTSQNPADNIFSDEKLNEWGIALEVENVTASGLTIVCNHSGGENVAELSTGSYYVVQKFEKAGWVDVEYLPQEYDVVWTLEAWIIQQESTTKWDVNWEWLYGKLSAGEYRIGKEIMNFRGTGDYDTEMVYAGFVIK